MVIILLLFSYYYLGSTTGTPLIVTYASNILTRNKSTLSLEAESLPCTCTDQRSIWDIVWSCLATIFACTWVSVHPDIPDPDEKWWIVVTRRAELVVWTFLAPEFVICWAMNQWYGARKIAKEQKGKGWGKTHGYFMQMGGFMLYDGNQKMGTLSYPRFKRLLAKNRIEFPTITQEEIKDRSKSDGLSKILVVGQTGWFILQCIARRVEKLPMTELELATLAFAVLNGCMYFFWWDKPFDVRYPVPVRLRKTKSDKSVETDDNESGRDDHINYEGDEAHVNNARHRSGKLTVDGNKVQYQGILNTEGNDEKSTLIPDEDVLGAAKKPLFDRQVLGKVLTVLGERLSALTYTNDNEVFKFNTTVRPEAEVGPMQVPTFYSLLSKKDAGYGPTMIFLIGPIFGAIHCTGWFFHFPTVAELWIWRVASLHIAVYPILMGVIVNMHDMLGDWKYSESLVLSALYYAFFVIGLCLYFFFGLFLYIIARFLLLAESLSTLRELPPGAYDVVQWTFRLPHI